MPKNLYFSKLLDFYDFALKDRQKEVMELYYNNDLSLSEIADNIGISKQGVRDIIKRAESLLLNLDRNFNIVIKTEHSKKSLEEIINLCNVAKDASFIGEVERLNNAIGEIEVLAKDLLQNDF